MSAISDRTSHGADTLSVPSLDLFFHPRGVALIGASHDPAKLGYAILRNLLDPDTGFSGPVYPVNPKADAIFGRRCYPDIMAVPDPVDLAVIVVPAASMLSVMRACSQRGIKAAVIISGGFREVGAEGAAIERQVIEIARRAGMRVMGPNCIGVMDTHTPINTTFVGVMPAPGHIAFLSQSGALCGGVTDWIVGRGIGFSRLVSMGNEADVNETDMLPVLAADEQTEVITLYLEDIKGGPGFVAALRDAAAHKPVLALKAGRTTSGQTATASHTGALASAHAAFRAVCRQTGVIECATIKDLFHGAMALEYQPPLRGQRIAILTNAGGPAALAADALEPLGLTLAHTSAATQATLRGFLLPDAQVAGPVDMLGGARAGDYQQALAAVLDDEATDGVLIILVPQAVVDPTAVVRAISQVAESHPSGKPLVACLMGEASLGAAFAAAHAHQIPAYTFPEEASAALGVLRQRGRWLASAHPAPVMPAGMDLRRAQSLLDTAQRAGRQTLDAVEGQVILQAIGLTVPSSELVTTPEEAATAAARMGFPVALKLISPEISHKTEVGGVLLDIHDATTTRDGFQTLMKRAQRAQASARGVQVQRMISGGQQVIIGAKRDPALGPLVMFGMGGIYAEALADVSFRLAPLSRADAEEMIDEVRAARLLAGLRGAPPADRQALVDALLRVGWLAHASPQLSELDINPLLVLPEGEGVVAVDARLVTR
ncbi:MAG: acetate--CoA ligase family protein [Nitrososphaerota archaeon]